MTDLYNSVRLQVGDEPELMVEIDQIAYSRFGLAPMLGVKLEEAKRDPSLLTGVLDIYYTGGASMHLYGDEAVIWGHYLQSRHRVMPLAYTANGTPMTVQEIVRALWQQRYPEEARRER